MSKRDSNLLMLDNNSIFTSSLTGIFKSIHQTVRVAQNNKITVAEIKKLNPDCVVISSLTEHGITILKNFITTYVKN